MAGTEPPYADEDRRPFTDNDIFYVGWFGFKCGVAGAVSLGLLVLLARRLLWQ